MNGVIREPGGAATAIRSATSTVGTTLTFNCAHCGASRFAEVGVQGARHQLQGILALAKCPRCGRRHRKRLIVPLLPWFALTLPAVGCLATDRTLNPPAIILAAIGVVVPALSFRRWKTLARSVRFDLDQE